MQSKEEVVAFLESIQGVPDRQGFQAEISFLNLEKINAFKASLFRDAGSFRYVGPAATTARRRAPGVWTFETEDGFARARVVFDWRDGDVDGLLAFMTVDLAGEPVWIDREPFRADLHQFAALWAAMPEDVKGEYRWYSTNTLKTEEAKEFIADLDGYVRPEDGSDLAAVRSEREIIEHFIGMFDGEQEADIPVIDWVALDGFKQRISFADPEGWTIETAEPEEVGERWTYAMKSPDGFVNAYFNFERLPTFFGSVELAGEPWWPDYDANECTHEQLRDLYAMLPQEAKDHLRKVATEIDPDYYVEMIEYVAGSAPEAALAR